MKRIKFIFSIYLLFVVFICNAQAFTVGNLNYSVNTDGSSVTVLGHIDGNEATGSITIPNTVSYSGINYAVTRIGDHAFSHTHSLHGTLTIGNNVKDIGDGAFLMCDSLSGNLIIPNSVMRIGSYAFQDCKSFKGSLVLPNSIDTIGTCAFEQCCGFDGTLIIPESVLYIGDMAFQMCSGFNNIESFAMVPPVLPSSQGPQPWLTYCFVFYGFGCSTITVPCGSKEAYENSPWQSTYCFSTIIQDCEYIAGFDVNNMAIYPNPTSGIIKIEAEDIQNVSIYNIFGEKIFENAVQGNSFEYNLSSQKSGVYIIKVSLGDATELYEHIVKN